ncbi:MAG: hypothetical protein FJZ96_05605 [Chloroflexi bacterium]|nr:hypothetical protein [Chloroflexota bacterium]
MSEIVWEVSKTCFCEHAGQEVSLEKEVAYPADFLPDRPRILAHRCSHGLTCNQFNRPACLWAGANPDYDPFR